MPSLPLSMSSCRSRYVRPGPIYGPGERRSLKMIGGVARGRFVVVGTDRHWLEMVYVEDRLVEGIRLAGETPAAIGKKYISHRR